MTEETKSPEAEDELVIAFTPTQLLLIVAVVLIVLYLRRKRPPTDEPVN